jgi:hypothetical protein
MKTIMRRQKAGLPGSSFWFVLFLFILFINLSLPSTDSEAHGTAPGDYRSQLLAQYQLPTRHDYHDLEVAC